MVIFHKTTQNVSCRIENRGFNLNAAELLAEGDVLSRRRRHHHDHVWNCIERRARSVHHAQHVKINKHTTHAAKHQQVVPMVQAEPPSKATGRVQ